MEEMKKLKEIGNEKQTETFEEETESEGGSEEEGDKSEIEERPESSQIEKIGRLIKPTYRLHKHPMIFRSGDVVGPGNSLGCRGCWRLIEGAHYACDDKRCKYYLHEFCYNLPLTISNHPLHSEHKLILLPGSSAYSAECKVCGKQCKGSRYHCFRCPGFNLDLLCAWVPSTIQTRAHHQHNSLSRISRPSIFSCDACHIKLGNKTFSYMCFTCQYWVHLDCAFGPPDDDLRTRMSDNHPLELREYCFNFCKLCEKQIKEQCYVYGCQECNRYSHIGCVALAILSLRTSAVEASLMYDAEDLVEQILVDISWMMGGLDVRLWRKRLASKIEGLSIQHWTHDHQDHPLKFGASIDGVPGIDRKRFECNGCKWPLTAPFYSCMKCNFFLHIECVGLLRKVRVRHAYTHNHDSRRTHLKIEMISEGSRCSHCNNPHSGYSYKCQECEYRLDPICAQIRGLIWHPSHQHVLCLLEETLKHRKKCNACGESIEKKLTAYFCSLCEFNLHIKCAFLPERSRHRFDHHDLILMFKSAKNKFGEYICDICEDENRDPNLWFYGCEECDFAAHVDCVHGQ